jgi:hypothetical protein
VGSEARDQPTFDRRIGRRVRFDDPRQAIWSPTVPSRRRARSILVRMIDVSVTGALFEAQGTSGIETGCRGELRVGDRASLGVIRRVEPGEGKGTRRCSAEFLDNELSWLPYDHAARVCGDGEELLAATVAVPQAHEEESSGRSRPNTVAPSPHATGRPPRRRDLLGG